MTLLCNTAVPWVPAHQATSAEMDSNTLRPVQRETLVTDLLHIGLLLGWCDHQRAREGFLSQPWDFSTPSATACEACLGMAGLPSATSGYCRVGPPLAQDSAASGPSFSPLLTPSCFVLLGCAVFIVMLKWIVAQET